MPPASILKDCKSFLLKTKPLYKELPSNGEGFRRVKVRRKAKYKHSTEQYFDIAFKETYKDLTLRSLLVHTTMPTTVSEGFEVFYIFPIDGFKVLCNENIAEHSKYMSELDLKLEDDIAQMVLPTLFEDSYTSDVDAALATKSDIVIFDIKYYYAVRVSLVEDYKSFIST